MHAHQLVQRRAAAPVQPKPRLYRSCACPTQLPHAVERAADIAPEGDPLEREADRAADSILFGNAPQIGNHPSTGVHAKCGACEQQAAQAGGGTDRRAREKSPVGQGAVDAALAAVTRGGAPLSAPLRDYFEPRFSRDFSQVRVFTAGAAASAARAIGARAYTHDEHIAFAPGEFDPTTAAGRHLIAHELAHVVQQRRGAPRAIRRVSIGEAWGAFWGAGPLDAYRGRRLATEALAAAQQTGLPGLHNGPADAWRHCYWNCRMVEEINAEDAADIAENHEEHGGNSTEEREMDTHNNEVGRRCSGGCDGCCRGHLNSGRLWILGPGGGIVRSGPVAGRTPNPTGYERY